MTAITPPPLNEPPPMLASSMEATLCAFCRRRLGLLRLSSGGGGRLGFEQVGLIQTSLI
jgi:hypothetical protein